MSHAPRTAPAPRSFLAAYDDVLAARWPAGTTATRIPTPYGTTHVNSCGPEDAPPLVLLPGGGATSTVWFAQAAHLARTHRVHAPDLIGDPGRSTTGERPLRTAADLAAWLDAVLDALGADRPALCGHSYGGWIALRHALHAPGRVSRLVLVDPTQCFAGFRPGYLLHALPMLLRPTARRTRAFLAWETGGAALDPAWARLRDEAAAFPTARPVTGPRPSPEELRGLTTPALVLLAERGRAHDSAAVAATVHRLLPHAETATLTGATHHSLPSHGPGAAELNRRAEEFLTAPARP
ncbi:MULTISPECIES: alpha/beta hydrolase [unclassified Streptomyces]|uniref:alpha/beta fold hydrolase n=1 Tax=unclassified Streptomyces TaxID=2593676 RepID=UPI0001C19305|nr:MULTISPECIES: alpha/beta hydrolase [unclassified Streptomyces]AEN09542.1 alpha/beta hydrolase fold protein [Streptomyces sp. SirexAA-E]MYR70214.1 alpha/beta fold hydrolase [Streptomyces sp. SID4939]MYS03896.1 alpha/beta fold hydrolase [Streptomyces sp. SID4940]MYT64598.1 alpha/beta fold hydrolase [Streptomyces sp. SID8357]MYT87411.1 alpha/beta fold hydrolase [Streptomyces sp. SID8360]